MEQVKAYAKVFWKQYRTLPGKCPSMYMCVTVTLFAHEPMDDGCIDWEKLVGGIERGETRLQKSMETQDHLLFFLEHYHENTDYHFPRNKTFTPEEDHFILDMLAAYGYGTENVYELIREEIRRSPKFRFDWFLRTRTAADLSKRALGLIPSVQKWVQAKRSSP